MKKAFHARNLKIVTLLFGVAAFLFSMVFMNVGMAMDANGAMAQCPFSMQGSICSMNFPEHLEAFKVALSALPQKLDMAVLLFLAVAAAVALEVFKNILGRDNISSLSQLVYLRRRSMFLFDPLREAFSQGIINPKIF